METTHQHNSNEAGEIVESFLHCSLAKERYTHAAHILSGFYLYCHHGKHAFELMEKHILLFNNAVGTINSDDSGYHKTITFFWMKAIEQFASRFDECSFIDRNILAIYNSPLMDKTLPLKFYTREYLFTKKARKEIVEPDIKPILDIF
ncbi:MAG: hypothetical protein JST75_10045 [Bacteroidetes bacterium]|nr:hypothetical protein [Bacteroidota bacterium]